MTTVSSKRAGSDRAKPDRAKPDHLKHDQMKPDRVKPDRVKPDPVRAGRVNGTAGPAGGRLIDGKLAIPRAVFPVLRRTRLVNLLDAATQHRVTLMSAPAGSGKSTACSSWAQVRLDKMRIAWLSLDHADNNPARFRDYLLAALQRAAGLDQQQRETLRGIEHCAPEDFPLPLVKAAEKFADPVSLVLDDIHEVSDPTVLGWLDQLVRHAPPMLRLILSGRRTPPLQLARLRVSGDLADINATDLACTAEEAESYFSMLGLRVDRADRDALLRHTQGWMAGLRLAALRCQPRHPGAGIADLAGDDPIVTDYLRDEVLADQDPQIRAFLLRTSMVEDLTGKLANALTGTTDGDRCLDLLSRENGFVEVVDSDRSWYRYHPLLRELLRAELRREMPQEIPALACRAARWYAQNGRPADALRCCVAAQDWDYAGQVLAASDITILLSGGPAQFERMLAPIPPDVVDRDVAIGGAWAAARLWHKDPDGARASLETAAAALPSAGSQTQRIMAPKLEALRVMQASLRPDGDPALLARAWSRAEQAPHGTAQAEHRALGVLWWVLGMAHLRRSELTKARYALRTADRELGSGDAAQLQARARVWWALAEAWHGNLTAAQHAAADVLNSSPPAAPVTRHIARMALALVSLMRDELAVSHRLLDQIDYTDHTRVPGEPSLTTTAGLIRARTLIAQGDATRARATLSQLYEESGRSQPAVAEMITSLEGELAVRTGDHDLGRKIIARLMSDHPADPGPGDRLTVAWLLVAVADPQGALQAVQPFITGSADDARLHERVGALIVAAVAHRRLKCPERAAELLEQALLLAEPEGQCRVFIDGGPAVRSVLTVLIPPTSRSAGFAGKILQRLDSQLPVGSSAGNGDTQPLSDSELAVLRFLPSHLTNEEIGAALFLSVNTVKTHLRSAYRKLGVRSRREAIALARHHGLVALDLAPVPGARLAPGPTRPGRAVHTAMIRWRFTRPGGGGARGTAAA
jgi:LuxR family maltose regulon positive regulatory protein